MKAFPLDSLFFSFLAFFNAKARVGAGHKRLFHADSPNQGDLVEDVRQKGVGIARSTIREILWQR